MKAAPAAIWLLHLTRFELAQNIPIVVMQLRPVWRWAQCPGIQSSAHCCKTHVGVPGCQRQPEEQAGLSRDRGHRARHGQDTPCTVRHHLGIEITSQVDSPGRGLLADAVFCEEFNLSRRGLQGIALLFQAGGELIALAHKFLYEGGVITVRELGHAFLLHMRKPS